MCGKGNTDVKYLFCLSLFTSAIIVMALLGMFNIHRHGAINSAAIVLYALTSCVSGYVSCSFYTQINGQRWVWNIILTSSLFSGEVATGSTLQVQIILFEIYYASLTSQEILNVHDQFYTHSLYQAGLIIIFFKKHQTILLKVESLFVLKATWF